MSREGLKVSKSGIYIYTYKWGVTMIKKEDSETPTDWHQAGLRKEGTEHIQRMRILFFIDAFISLADRIFESPTFFDLGFSFQTENPVNAKGDGIVTLQKIRFEWRWEFFKKKTFQQFHLTLFLNFYNYRELFLIK